MREAATDCDDVPEAFLHDMTALDHHQPKPKGHEAVSKVSPPPQPAVVQTPRLVKKKRLNPSWLKRKRELEALRAQTEAYAITNDKRDTRRLHGVAMLQSPELLALLSSAAPSSMEQSVLESFLQEMDVLNMNPVTPKRGKQPARKKREAKTTRQRAGIKPAPSWKRRKEELQSLRAEAEALHTLLETSKLKRDRTMALDPLRKYWMDVAESERLGCEEARSENARLKTRLERNKRAFEDVKEALELVKVQQSEISTYSFVPVAELDSERFVSSVVFDLLENRADERLVDLNSIYLDSCVRLPELDLDQVNVRRRTMNQDVTTALELKRTRLMPYSAEKTAQVMWNVMDLGAVPDGQLNIVKRSDNLMVSDGCFTNQLDCGGVVEIRSRCVMKRFLVPEGFIVMIEGVSEWLVRPSCSEEWRHVTRDSGWGIVHPVAEGGLCQLQTGLHLQENEWGLKMSDVSHKTPSLLSRGVGEVMIPSFRKIIESRHQLVDNKLLDSSL